MIATGPLDAFFKLPSAPPSDEGDSVLYHLRVDLETMLGPEGVVCGALPPAPILAAMGLLSAIDLLGKAYRPQLASRPRFKKILADLAGLTAAEAESLYQLRCGLLHAGSLFSIDRSNQEYTFTLTDRDSDPLIVSTTLSATRVESTINFWELKALLPTLIEELRHRCYDDLDTEAINGVAQLAAERIAKA